MLVWQENGALARYWYSPEASMLAAIWSGSLVFCSLTVLTVVVVSDAVDVAPGELHLVS